MHKRTAHRWRLTIIMLAGVFLAFGSFWMLQVFESADADLQADALKNEPDYIVEKFSYVRMAADGKPRYLISGDKLTHRPIDDTADVLNPRVRSVGEDRPPMSIVANTARVDHGNTQVHLTGDVSIERKSAAGSKMTLETQTLTIFPDADQMKTDQPVRITGSDGTTATGTGLFVDNAAGRIDINNDVHMAMPAKRRP